MKNKSVIQLMKYSAPYKGNFIQSILCLEEKLKQEGKELIYVFVKETATTDWAAELISQGKKIHFLTGNRVRDFFLVKSLIRKYNVGVIHTHFIGVADISLLRLMNLFRRRKCLIFRHLHNPYTSNNVVIEYAKTIFAHVDVSIACSKAVAYDYRLKKKDQREKVVFVTNAIEFSRLNEYEPLNRNALGINDGAFLLLVYGFDYYRKGIDILVNAVSQLVKDNMNICLVISFANNREFAENEIKKQFGNIPSWIKPVKPRNDIGTYYRFSDAFISSSRSEGFCYSLVEAAYCGTQIIASDIVAQKDLDIPYTFQYSVEDISDLKKQISAAINLDKQERTRRAAIQKDYAMRTFNIDKWAESIVEIYKTEAPSVKYAVSLQ